MVWECPQIVDLMAGLDGKWAIVLVHAKTGAVWFGRDVLGCRSLLFATGRDARSPILHLSSVAGTTVNTAKPVWTDLAAGAICKFELSRGASKVYLLNQLTSREVLERHLPTFGTDLQFNWNFVDSSIPSCSMTDITCEIDTEFTGCSGDLDGYFEHPKWSTLIDKIINLLQQSLSKRLFYYTTHSSEPLAILFSGGLDSALLAALAAGMLPNTVQIDLINVAFGDNCEKAPGATLRPHRILGRISLENLSKLWPQTQWNFVPVDVSLGDLKSQREHRIKSLIAPADTVLDDSIGCALWFASRAVTESYRSKSRILLLGSGADELFAGYARHRTKFVKSGYIGLVEEMRMDLGRYWLRNMGRDNRVLTDHGREARMPFLDDGFVKFVNSLPINAKADLSLPRGTGEKLLLRLASRKLGLLPSAPKRAIQFGSRIAKSEVSTKCEKGTEKCSRLIEKC